MRKPQNNPPQHSVISLFLIHTSSLPLLPILQRRHIFRLFEHLNKIPRIRKATQCRNFFNRTIRKPEKRFRMRQPPRRQITPNSNSVCFFILSGKIILTDIKKEKKAPPEKFSPYNALPDTAGPEPASPTQKPPEPLPACFP